MNMLCPFQQTVVMPVIENYVRSVFYRDEPDLELRIIRYTRA